MQILPSHVHTIALSYPRTSILLSQFLDLPLQLLILPLLPLQESVGHPCLLFDTLGSEFIDIGGFVAGISEIGRLDQPFVHQRPEAIVGLAQGEAHLACEVALGELRVGFQGFEEVVVGWVVYCGCYSFVNKALVMFNK